jgi:hypothetical protein
MQLWRLEAVDGFDCAWVQVDERALQAEGRQVGLVPRPYELAYRLETDERFVTSRLAVESRWEGGRAELDLRRNASGLWRADGVPRPDLAGALDIDLAACPLMNSMPVLRHGLHRPAACGPQGGPEHLLRMAFVEVPDLRVVSAHQRYAQLRAREHADGAVVRFRSESFESELEVDGDGLVVVYPGLGHRLSGPSIASR